MSEEESLEVLLAERINAAKDLFSKLHEDQYAKILGIGKFRNRLASELRFLEGISEGKTQLLRKYIDTSNVTHFENIFNQITKLNKVKAILHTFTLVDKENGETLKHTADLVADGGEQWVKVVSRSAKGVAMDWLTGNDRNIFDQASAYLQTAILFPTGFVVPKITFFFMGGVPDKMAERLRRMGIRVHGEEVLLDDLVKVPSDLLEALEEKEDLRIPINSDDNELPPDAPINLDVSTVFVLVSNLTHEGGTEHNFQSKLLREQAVWEKSAPEKEKLLHQIEGHRWIICQTAYESVVNIVSTVAGPAEKKRVEELLKNVEVVEDKLTERSASLPDSERISARSRVIFGSGDYYRAVTTTANKHFVSSAYHQGVCFNVLVHEPRALSEQKEDVGIKKMSADSVPKYLLRKIDCNQQAVRNVKYNVDGNYVLTCGSDKTIKLWNPNTGAHVSTFMGVGNEILDMASSSDNSQLAAGGLDKCVTVIDVETGKTVRKYRNHAAKVNVVCYNEESNCLLSGSMDTTVHVYDVRTKNEKAIQIFNEATDAILSIDVNGHDIVVGSADGHYRHYSVRDGVVNEDFLGESVTSVSFTPDGNCILASTLDSTLRLMDKSNGKMLAQYKGHQNRDFMIRSCILASITEVATGSEDGNVHVYNLIDQASLVRLPHKSPVVHTVAAHPKKQELVSACASLIYFYYHAMIYVVVGGGVAGVSCVRCLRQNLSQEDEVYLITAGRHVKSIHNWIKVGQFTELFDVKEEGLSFAGEGVHVISASVTSWDYKNKSLYFSNGKKLAFDRLVIATGARPKNPYPHVSRVLTLRDTETARHLEERLAGARKVAIIGNGGIATELVYELRKVEIFWCIREEHISAVYFDVATAKFLEDRAKVGRKGAEKNQEPVKRMKYADAGEGSSTNCDTTTGCALGPDWSTVVKLEGGSEGHNVHVIPKVEVVSLVEKTDSLNLHLSNGTTLEVEIVIWATGVVPNSEVWRRDCPELKLAADNGICVDETMRTSIGDVWACGDVCTVEWPTNAYWTQMRTWTQARQMGDYTARRVLNLCDSLDFCFEMFAHCTTFYGYKIVLLGDFKATHQPDGWYIIERIIDDFQLARCVMESHRVRGAVLIGETDLEEVLENLILNGTDMTGLEEEFLDPDVHLEDYFD
ncbi:unnamed protein product, partial [Mesorhabditis belari]|uniref:Pyridine nucleotide-disulfide oxidoreductase domain-containing protein 1 n=1 Tax=Mesorhabditis belari TaxID=2138241 RepID=A0AAF3EYA7_9BILA